MTQHLSFVNTLYGNNKVYRNTLYYGLSFIDREPEVGACRLLTIYPTIRRQQRRGSGGEGRI